MNRKDDMNYAPQAKTRTAVNKGDFISQTIWVEGLSETLQQCYDQYVLPSETDADWARKGKRIDLHGYSSLK